MYNIAYAVYTILVLFLQSKDQITFQTATILMVLGFILTIHANKHWRRQEDEDRQDKDIV